MTNRTHEESLVDLEIRIFQLGEEGYPVEITLGGQQEFPRGYLEADVLPWVASGNPAEDGQKLFDILFGDGKLRNAWAEARGQAPQRRVRLRIDPGAAELNALPWESLTENQVMLAAHADTPFSRYLSIALPWSGEVEERPIRVLVVISNPDDLEEQYDLPPVDVDAEREVLESALAAVSNSVGEDELEVTFLDAPATPEKLEEKLREGYHVVHFVGHGAFSARRGQAALYMQDGEGRGRRVLDGELASIIARQSMRPQLVTLIACQSATRSTADAFTGLAPKLVSVGVPAVVAMQDAITVETAQSFESTFYQRLLEHGFVDQAINEARSTLLTAGRSDAAVPVLFMRLTSGQLWGAEADVRGLVLGAKQPRIFWSGLIKNIERGKCTPLIGPRAHSQWLPQPADIARDWAEEHGYPFKDREDLARVAQYIVSSQGEEFAREDLLDTTMRLFIDRLPEGLKPEDEYDTLTELIEAVGWQDVTSDDPNEVHKVLASLNLPLYLTTNVDSCMTEALKANGREPAREICPWNEYLDGMPSLFEDDPDYEPTKEAPLVYHLFGNDQQVDSLVLTEDNYLDFLVQTAAAPERIPPHIWAALTNSSLMFIGYSLNDWEFRVVMRGLVATRQQRRRFKHVAVQLELDDMEATDTEAVQSFLQDYFQDAEINVYWGSLQQFVAELREQWEAVEAD